MDDVLHGVDSRTEPGLAPERGVPDGQHGGGVRYEYAVRWKEYGVWHYLEWSCGCPRLYTTLEQAQAQVAEILTDVYSTADERATVEVVRRPEPLWEPAEWKPQADA